jgi:glutathione S-transferase
MQLYEFPFSSNCRKVRAVAEELGIPLEYVRVDLPAGGSRTPAFLSWNPNGRVPVLVDGDFVLWESTAIIRYLASGSHLLPADRRAGAEVDRWMSWQLAHLAPAVSRVGFEKIVKRLTGRGEPDPAAVAAGSAEFESLTAILDAALAGREYVAGPLTLADFALAAHYSLAPACGLDVRAHRRVDSWLARMLARDSMRRALAEAESS